MPTVLITGASRGIGLEFARQYRAAGWHTIAACRKPGDAKALAGVGAEVRALDVTDAKQIQALAAGLAGRPIDVLINNAGVYGPREVVQGQVPADAWSEVFRVNTIAPRALSESLLANVAASGRKTIVAISSGMGSLAKTDVGRAYIYRSSKAALNMAMRTLAFEVRERGVTVALFHPGWVKTDMGTKDAPLTPTESVTAMRATIDRLTPEQTGQFFNYDGQTLPW